MKIKIAPYWLISITLSFYWLILDDIIILGTKTGSKLKNNLIYPLEQLVSIKKPLQTTNKLTEYVLKKRLCKKKKTANSTHDVD